jgi:hypothetical protein
MLGDVVVFRETRGQLVMSNRPKKPDVPTDHQVNVRSRFMEAVAYAKGVLADPLVSAEYEAAMTESSHSIYGSALTDYLKVPRILGIDHSGYAGLVGDFIRIRAIDDFRVETVRVEIRSAADVLIEQGNAVNDPAQSVHWNYAATQPNALLPGTRIRVFVTDRPGNTVNQIIELV